MPLEHTSPASNRLAEYSAQFIPDERAIDTGIAALTTSALTLLE